MRPFDMVDTVMEAERSTATVTSVRGGTMLSSTAGPLCGSGSLVTGGGQGSVVVNNVDVGRFDEDVNLPLVKVVVLGAPGVGKTSIVKVKKGLQLCWF
jgi:hypothetical protein